jgi:hypothetical protein
MRIRRDSAFISSVLFTVALLWLVPGCWNNALVGGMEVYFRPAPNSALQQMDSGSRALAQTLGQLGVASLTVISIGLIVTWMGYFNRIRWTWFVMFPLVWGWAYPILSMRLLIFNLSMRWITGLVHDAIHGPDPHLPRTLLQTMLIFTLMLIALILPIRSFLKYGRHEDLVKST